MGVPRVLSPSPPKSGHFLAQIECHAYRYTRGIGSWHTVGLKWVECFWNRGAYRVWCGAGEIITTEPCVIVDWMEMPAYYHHRED